MCQIRFTTVSALQLACEAGVEWEGKAKNERTKRASVREVDGRDACKDAIGHSGKYHNALHLFPQILHKNGFQFLMGLKWSQEKTKTMLMQNLGG